MVRNSFFNEGPMAEREVVERLNAVKVCQLVKDVCFPRSGILVRNLLT